MPEVIVDNGESPSSDPPPFVASKTRTYPPEYTVTNGVSSAVFSGPDAETDANEYAAIKNGPAPAQPAPSN